MFLLWGVVQGLRCFGVQGLQSLTSHPPSINPPVLRVSLLVAVFNRRFYYHSTIL